MTTIEEYIEAKRLDGQLADDTLRTRKNYLNKMDRWCQDNLDKQLKDISVKDAVRIFEGFLQPRWRKDTNEKVIRDDNGRFKRIETEGMSTDTARIYLNALESYLDEKIGILEREDEDFERRFSQMKDRLPDSDYSQKMAQTTPDTFERDELNDIMSRADKKYELIYKLMLDSGRRPREVSSLKVSNVDFDDGAINYTILKKSLPTKEKVFVDDAVMDMLKSYIDHQVDPSDEYIFATSSSQGFLTTSSMAKAFKRHAESAGVDLDGRSLKNLRHTYVTFRRAAGDTFASISQAGTHNTVRVMEKSYSGQGQEEEFRSGMGMLDDDSESSSSDSE